MQSGKVRRRLHRASAKFSGCKHHGGRLKSRNFSLTPVFKGKFGAKGRAFLTTGPVSVLLPHLTGRRGRPLSSGLFFCRDNSRLQTKRQILCNISGKVVPHFIPARLYQKTGAILTQQDAHP
ncbi:MAG: hypothetical protein HZB23_07775 [Deltaproteobacteria bacterium]|nr:hypothetical protein [Deltaproteobacteria bacterium]